jgi:Na+-translocating ferredoxin:NAD+ oxidoreductase RnfD subunit
VVALALVTAVDAVLCIKPARFIAACLDDVGCPERVRPWLPPVKAAAATGLLTGLVVPHLGPLTCAALVAYFAIAVTMHVRARDFGRNIVNATGLGVVSGAVAICFL